uniref:Uncharacterized protein LOC105108141 n=1 Tax=Rhizophora mucronata TaxID=61149 RepID=A0A2P2IQP6_RHIMU
MATSLEPSPKFRRNKDSAWKYCQMIKSDEGRVHMRCIYCSKMFKGGGIFRFKEHLAGRGGPMCQQVPLEVRLLMQQSLDEVVGKQSNRKKVIWEEPASVNMSPSDLEMSADQFDNSGPIKTRQKKDLGWQHCQMLRNGEREQIKCKYCAKMFKGGGIHRFKEHLAGRKGGGAPICERVPSDVQLLMQQNLDEIAGKQKGKQKLAQEEVDEVIFSPCDIDVLADCCEDVNNGFKTNGACDMVEPNSNMSLDQEEGTTAENLDRRKRRKGKASPIGNDVAAVNSSGLKLVDKPFHMTMGRFLYDIGANIDALDSIYFQQSIDMITSGGSRVVIPSNHDLRGWILKNLVEEIKSTIDQYRTKWEKTGCSILVEEWNSKSGRNLLNFLVYCSEGTVFLRSVDVTCSSTDSLYEAIRKVVEEVGAEHVLQVITKVDERYAVIGQRLMDTFHSLYWAPCAVHCIDMILEDFGNLRWISDVIEQARSVTRFVYNNSVVLDLMKRFTRGNDIVQQGVTHSATNFATLKRMADFKLDLQTMVTSQEWMDCLYSKQPGGLTMLDIVSSHSFWSSCISIIRLTDPLLRLLGIVSSEKRAAMGYVFAGIYRAKETIKRELVKKEDYMAYWNIIDHRWEQQQHPPLHAAGFFLNPKFFYSIDGDMHNEILSRMFDCIERLVTDIEVQDKIVKELNLYKNALGDLGRKMAIRARENLLPGK